MGEPKRSADPADRRPRVPGGLLEHWSPMIALVLVACSVGLSNFAAAVAIGVSGVTTRTRMEVALVFGAFEIGMPIIGLTLGHRLAHTLGDSTRWVGGGLLMAAGLYGLVTGVRAGKGLDAPSAGLPRGRLVLTGAALSVDNLVVGFALGTFHVSVIVAAVVIGLASVGLSLVGLELGDRIGARAGGGAEMVGSVVLIAVGATIALGLI
jgi:putative Mn2+ efflux pump MntP